jgi:hypothetical protein
LIRAGRITAIVTLLWAPVGLAVTGDDDGAGIVDPFAVIAKLDGFAGMPLWPGFDPSAHPVAIYDGERTLLLRHPDPPEEFTLLEGHEGVWVYAGRHAAMRWNSNVDLNGVRTATLMLTIQPGRAVDLEASFLLHEVFHLFSKPRHPTWKPDEMYRYSYPLDDVEKHTLLLMEEEALARALEAEEEAAAAGWAAAALRWRRQRTNGMAEEHRTFETALEMQEGTAVHVARLALGTPRDTTRLRETLSPEEIRWRFYDTGAALAAMLHRLDPSWKDRLEAEPGLAMDALLAEALRRRDTSPAELPAPKIASIRARAEQAVADLKARRARLRKDFLSRSPRVVVMASGSDEPLRLSNFDPLALEILDGGEALHSRRLTLEAPTGKIEVENPSFERGSLQGVVSLTAPAGAHPFLDGVSRVTVSGFAGRPEVGRKDGVVSVEAEGLTLSFQGAVVRTLGDEVQVQLQPPVSSDN